MSDLQAKSEVSSGAVGLLLRVEPQDGNVQEFYLASGLTIGRSAANTVQLADDDAVERNHARLELLEDGSAELSCLAPDARITTGGARVHELCLSAGVSFSIGKTNFRCVSGLLHPYRGSSPLDPACPCCGFQLHSDVVGQVRSCENCSQAILPLDLQPTYCNPVVVPVQYGAYSVRRFVAQGGMGVVLKGIHETNGDSVAIKLLLPSQSIERQAAERFRQEILLLKQVRHPHVVRLLDYGRVGQINYLVMRWAEGPNLRDTLIAAKQRNDFVRFDVAFRWLKQVCDGLAALHAVGIIHRDLKPSNILTTNTGEAVVSDLGIAKTLDMSSVAITTMGYVVGTHEYMAPEQWSTPDAVDQRTDLYSLGVTFYELLTSRLPVGTWEAAAEINPTVPASFDAILAKLLPYQMDHRYTDIHELIADLRSYHRSPVPAAGPSDVEKFAIHTEKPIAAVESDKNASSAKIGSAMPDHNRAVAGRQKSSWWRWFGECVGRYRIQSVVWAAAVLSIVTYINPAGGILLAMLVVVLLAIASQITGNAPAKADILTNRCQIAASSSAAASTVAVQPEKIGTRKAKRIAWWVPLCFVLWMAQRHQQPPLKIQNNARPPAQATSAPAVNPAIEANPLATAIYWQRTMDRLQTPVDFGVGEEKVGTFIDRFVKQLQEGLNEIERIPQAGVDAELVRMVLRHELEQKAWAVLLNAVKHEVPQQALDMTIKELLEQGQQEPASDQLKEPQKRDKVVLHLEKLCGRLDKETAEQSTEVKEMQARLTARYPGYRFSLPEDEQTPANPAE